MITGHLQFWRLAAVMKTFLSKKILPSFTKECISFWCFVSYHKITVVHLQGSLGSMTKA